MKKKFVWILLLSFGIANITMPTAQKVYAAQANYDVDGNNVLNSNDLEALKKYYNTYNSNFDYNNDGIIDIYDMVILSNALDTKMYSVKNSSGAVISYYSSGDLASSVLKARSINGSVVMTKGGQVIWNNSGYYVFQGEKFYNKYSNSFDAVNAANSITNGRAYNQFGQELINNTTGYKEKLAVTSTDVYIRTQPSDAYKTSTKVPNNTLIEIVALTRGFYQFKWYKPDNTIVTGYLPNYLDFIQDDRNNSMFGNIAGKYESNGDPGAISDNPADKGGVSCGVFQFAANVGTLASFISWLSGTKPAFYSLLNNAYIADGNTYGTNFKAAWQQIAANNYDEFYALQFSYTKSVYYDGFINKAKNSGYDISKLAAYNATRNMIFSTSIQHGVTGAYNIIAPIDKTLSMTDFITSVYNGRLAVIAKSYPVGSSIYNGVKDRYDNESADIKRNYQREISY
ncbi:hypothetical protein [Clostridium sp. YIM B02551]|uniref:VgrG-related protein n=1 Tax=Clostridium sp. YIM B02551 TaxID=2910679 RepID=UPI001EEA5D4F|nr:hypothetical protein [Clostridium sp. YIM B02551]